jgi:flap endonuclease-1
LPGIKPVYVFDGKPPQLKTDQLAQRLSRREEATEGLAAAKESGDAEAVEKYSKRTVKVGLGPVMDGLLLLGC